MCVPLSGAAGTNPPDKHKKTTTHEGWLFFRGGASRTRTYDPIDVNDVLYRLSHGTMSLDDVEYISMLSRPCQALK